MNTLIFKTKLESNIIQLFNIGDFIGKEVIISIIELPEIVPKKTERKWNYFGAIKLNQQLDNVNIRDFAYD